MLGTGQRGPWATGPSNWKSRLRTAAQGRRAAATTSTLGALSLSLLDHTGAAANFHGIPGSGVSGLNVALDFSTNSDFTFAGGDFFGVGPIAAAKTSTALNYGAVKSFTTTIWFKPNDSTTWTGNVGPRIYILGTNGVTDKNVVNSIGLYYQAANEISFNFNGNEVDPTAGATGPDYTLGQSVLLCGHLRWHNGDRLSGNGWRGDGNTGVTKGIQREPARADTQSGLGDISRQHVANRQPRFRPGAFL